MPTRFTKISRARALRVLLFAILALPLGSPSLSGQETKVRTAADEIEAIDAYFTALESFKPKELEVRGMTVSATVVPDLRAYTIAKELRTAHRNGWDSLKIESHLKKEGRKLSKLKNRFRVRFSIEPEGRKDHVFLQAKLKKHVKVEGDGKIKEVSAGKPAPRYNKWQIIQGASIKRFTLAKIDSLSFDVTVEQKKQEACTVSLVQLMHYFEAPKKSQYQATGINASARQISLGNIADMAVDPIYVELAPATWDAPELPEVVKEALEKLDAKGP